MWGFINKSYKSYYHLHVKREDEKIHPTAKEAWPSLKKVQVSWEFKIYCPIYFRFYLSLPLNLFIFFLSRIGLYFLRWFKKRKKISRIHLRAFFGAKKSIQESIICISLVCGKVNLQSSNPTHLFQLWKFLFQPWYFLSQVCRGATGDL